MILIDSSRSLEIVLTTAVTTFAMPVVGAFVAHNSSFAVTALTPIVTTTNGTTVVPLVAAPASGVCQVKTLTVYNLDTVVKTVKVQMSTSGTKSIVIQATIDVGDTLQYSDINGWSTLTSSGQVKTGAALALSDDSVVTTKILNNNVTNAKLAQMLTATVKGNSQSTTANVADLDMAALFSILKVKIPVAYAFALTDETNPISSNGDKVKGIRIPFNMSCTGITGSLSVAQSAGPELRLNVKRSSTTLFSTQMVFALGSRLSTTAVLTTTPTALFAQDEIIGEVTQVGTAAAIGAKITIHGFMA